MKKEDGFRVVYVALATIMSVFLLAIYARPSLAATRADVRTPASPRVIYVVEFKYFSTPEKELVESLLDHIKPPL